MGEAPGIDRGGVAAGSPVDGTGEVVIIRTLSATEDIWSADWLDDRGHIVTGSKDVPLDACLAWSWSDAKPSEIRIITSNPPAPDGRTLTADCQGVSSFAA
jgi:hypothetical protein